MKKYEGYLICTDFDGTFALPNARLSEENLEAVSYFQQNGGLFTIASGRTPTFIRELGDRFRPNAPIIAMNGAMLCDENDGHVLRRFPMSRDVLEIMDDIAATVDLQTAAPKAAPKPAPTAHKSSADKSAGAAHSSMPVR